MNKTPRTCCLCKEPFYPVTYTEKHTNLCNRCLGDGNMPNMANPKPNNSPQPLIPTNSPITKYKCANCNEEEVEHKGDWCENCDNPLGDKYA
jgi:hypothetical protein